MSDVALLIDEVGKHGRRVERIGSDMLRLVGPGQIPGWLLKAIRKSKADLLEELERRHGPEPAFEPPTTAAEFRDRFGVWPWNIPWDVPHPGRRSLKPEFVNGVFNHYCPECGRWAPCGREVDFRRGRLGTWRCTEHDRETSHG